MLLSGHQTFTTLTLELRPDFGVHPWSSDEAATGLAKRANETITREKKLLIMQSNRLRKRDIELFISRSPPPDTTAPRAFRNRP